MNIATAVMSATLAARPHLERKAGLGTANIFLGILAIGVLFAVYSLVREITDAGGLVATWFPASILLPCSSYWLFSNLF